MDSLAASGAARSAQFTVVAAYNADGGGLKKAKIVLAPNITAVGFAALTVGQKAAYQPEGGIVQVGANSVSDFESHCFNDPVNNNVKLLLYWLQTMRQTQIVSDEYLKAIEAPTANEFFKVFSMLPYAEQVKQQNKLFNDRWWVSIFKGQAINQYQNSEQWQGLAGGDVGIPKVYDIDDPSCLLEYKANAIGIDGAGDGRMTHGRIVPVASLTPLQNSAALTALPPAFCTSVSATAPPPQAITS